MSNRPRMSGDEYLEDVSGPVVYLRSDLALQYGLQREVSR